MRWYVACTVVFSGTYRSYSIESREKKRKKGKEKQDTDKVETGEKWKPMRLEV